MNNCLLCDKEIVHEELKFKLKKETKVGKYRTTNLQIHQTCLHKFIWDKQYPHLKLNDFLIENLSITQSIDGDKGWKIGTYKITKFTQENIDRIEKNLIKKMAKKELLK